MTPSANDPQGQRFSAGAWLFPDTSVDKLVRICQLLEEAGFDYVWIGDEGLNRDCYVTAAAILVQTKRIKVGTGITNPYNRNPAVSAAATATLDELSAGRSFLGFGAGGHLNLLPMGLEGARPVVALREAVDVARRLFSGGTVDYDGELFQLHAAHMPYARPDIEIHMAGRGPKVLELAGEVADGVLLSGTAKFDFPAVLERIRAGATRSGRTPRLFLSGLAAYDEDSLERSRTAYGYMIRNQPQHVKDRVGFTAEVEQRSAEATIREGYRAAARYVTDDILREFIFMGSRRQVAAEIADTMQRHGMEVYAAKIDSSLPLETVRDIADVVAMAQTHK